MWGPRARRGLSRPRPQFPHLYSECSSLCLLGRFREITAPCRVLSRSLMAPGTQYHRPVADTPKLAGIPRDYLIQCFSTGVVLSPGDIWQCLGTLLVVTTLGGCCGPRQGRGFAPYDAPARPHHRGPPRPSVSGAGRRDPDLVPTSYSSSRDIGGHGGEGVCSGPLSQRDRTGPGPEHGPAGPGHPAEEPRAEALAPGGRESEESGRGRGWQTEAARPVGAWAGMQTHRSDILGKKFLGTDFLMRQQLPWVPAAGCVPGVGCPDTASQWGLGCMHLRMGPLEASNPGLRSMMTRRENKGPQKPLGVPGTAQTCPVSTPVRQGAPRLLMMNNGVAGAFP